MDLKILLRKACFFMLFSLFGLAAFSQKTVTGVVKDKSGEPMIGVNVIIKGEKGKGSVTDINGKFSIPDVMNSAILHVSYIGYITKELSVGRKSDFSIRLEEDTKALDEVVVVGYGTVKKKDLTGSVSSVSKDVITAHPVSNVAQALEGKLAGVNVIVPDGRPGADISIRIRGGGSVTQSNEPLYVVDGFPVSDISDVPAAQIASIDILKDASSTAIYGARGANGVVLVTTKEGKSGIGRKARVSYNGYFQMKEAEKTLDVLNAKEYIDNTWAYAAALDASGFAGKQEGVAKYFGIGSYDNGSANYDRYANMGIHDYTDDLLRTANTQSHNLSVIMGNDKTNMAFFANYIDDEGIKINSGYKRFNTAFKVNHNISDKLKVNFDVRYMQNETTGKDYAANGKGSDLSGAYRYRPIDNPLGDKSAYASFGEGADNIAEDESPVDYTNDVINKNNKKRVRGSGALSWEIIKGLTARTELNANLNNKEEKYYEDGLTKGYKYAKLTLGDGYGLRSATTLNYKLDNIAEYNDMSFLIGNELLKAKSNSSRMIGAGYNDSFDFNKTFGMINMTDPSLGKDSYEHEIGVEDKTVSFFGRANYTYKDRYLFTATFRADGSSKFAPNNRWGYFPAGAFAWRISDEPFMESSGYWLNNLKLRLSLGASGADNINSSLWKETWTAKTATINGESTTIYEPNGMLSNPDLKWETTISRNVGLDYGFFNNKIYGSVDVYNNTTKDLLMCVPIDATTGYTYQYQNIGKTSNKGVELNINLSVFKTDDFTLDIGATYNFNKNNIDELSDNVTTKYGSKWASSATQPSYDYEFAVGHSVGLVRGYKSDGFYTVNDFNYDPSTGIYKLKDGIADLSSIVGNYPNEFNLPEGQIAFPGAIKLRDVSGSDGTPDGVVDESDICDLGELTPKHTGGFNINATYKNFDFNASFTWQIGGNVYNANAMVNMYGNKDVSLGANRLDLVNDCYKIYDVRNGNLEPVTDPEELSALNKNAKYGVPYNENGIVLSSFIEDASFLRLNTLTLGYTIPDKFMSPIHISRCRLYFTATNLFLISGYNGLDPEVSANNNLNSSQYQTVGLDFGTYPRSRTYTFGLNLEF